MIDLNTMSDVEVCALRNDVIAEANKRQARAEARDRMAAVISSSGMDATEADAVYAEARAQVLEQSEQAPEELPEQAVAAAVAAEL